MSKQNCIETALEMSRPVIIDTIHPDKPRVEKIEASREECLNLAKRFDLKELLSLNGELTVLRVSNGNIVRVQGNIKAEVVQTCVVSFQNVPAKIDVEIDDSFVKSADHLDKDGEFEIEVDAEFDDVINGGAIDLGELVAQHLSLELDPYPKAPGVSLPSQVSGSGGTGKNNPFQILENLKNKNPE